MSACAAPPRLVINTAMWSLEQPYSRLDHGLGGMPLRSDLP